MGLPFVCICKGPAMRRASKIDCIFEGTDYTKQKRYAGCYNHHLKVHARIASFSCMRVSARRIGVSFASNGAFKSIHSRQCQVPELVQLLQAGECLGTRWCSHACNMQQLRHFGSVTWPHRGIDLPAYVCLPTLNCEHM